MRKLLRHRHFPFSAGAALGLAAAVPAFIFVPRLAVVIAADLFFAAYLILTLIRLPDLTAAYLKKHAESTDEPIGIIFAVTLLTIGVATGSLFIILNAKPAVGMVSLLIAGMAVLLGWLTIHMMAALHYARLYWRPMTSEDGRGTGEPGKGLEFPGGGEPDAADFLYFSYVIGMTAQTSDVNITSAQIRRINLVHAIVSFFFNTVIVAAAVNLVVSFGN